jgi:PAS domain S-box-containing protein
MSEAPPNQSDLHRAQEALRENEEQLRLALESANMGIWDYDIATGRVTWSGKLEVIHGLAHGTFGGTFQDYLSDIHPDDYQRVIETLNRTLCEGVEHKVEYRIVLPDGSVRWVEGKGTVVRDQAGKPVRMTGVCLDVTERKNIEASLREQSEVIETVNRVGQVLAAELDLQKLVQALTDAATELCGARFGSFFYNVVNKKGPAYMLYTLSGVPIEHFAHFPMPRATDMFGPTFRGEGVIRLDDVRQDPRYGKNSPYYGIPPGHLPVVSYLAVPVVSRSGGVLGGLFFGHPEAGVFSEREERIIVGLAAQAAIAIDNARLFEMLESERSRLEESEQRYRFLAESVPQVVWTTDADGYVDYFNARWYELTGQTPEEARGWGWQAALHPEDLQVSLERWVESVETGTAYEIEYRIRRASDGAYRWHLGRAAPMRDEQGRTVKWFGSTTDIDDQKRSEESFAFLAEVSRVLASSLNYEATLENVARLTLPHIADWCAVDILEADGRIRPLAIAHRDQARVERVSDLRRRYPPDPNRPSPLIKVLSTGRAELAAEIPDSLVESVARDGEHLRMIKELGLRSLIIVPMVARGRTIGAITLASSESGRVYGAGDLALAEDLAQRAAMAIDNSRLYQESQQASRLKDEFLATVSHELRTPLNAMLGWARMMRTGRLDEATAAEALEIIERNAKSQAQLVEDLLDVSRIVTGKLRLDVQPVALAPVIEAAIATVLPAADAKGIRIQKLLDPDAGPVSGDGARLQQVVWNLLSNAIKFTPRGGRVEVLLGRVDSHLEITVSDTGQGINPEFLPHVFESFRQADSSLTRNFGGLGLGLAIVRHLAELHGGTAHAYSAGEGQGASFTVKLPLMVMPDAERFSAEAATRHRAGAGYEAAFDCLPTLGGLRVLVVDDERDTRELLVAVLGQCGAEVTPVASVADALAALDDHKPDVVVSDVEMPGEDGYSFIRKLRALEQERGWRLPAAALTAHARVEDRMRALSAGFDTHVVKPVEPAELVTVIASLARRSREYKS